MIKKLYRIIKSIVFAAFFLYGYNIIAVPLNLIVPINLITVILVSLLGLPAIFGIVILSIISF